MTQTDSLEGTIRRTLVELGSLRPDSGFLVQQLSGAPAYHLGYDKNGLIALIAPPELGAWPPLRLDRLSFTPVLRAQLSWPEGGVEERDVAVILLDVSDGQFVDALPSLLAGVVTTAGRSPQEGDVGRAVRALREMFQALDSGATRNYLGVWGELFAITNAAEPSLLAAAWGGDPSQTFDFGLEGDRLEVKTTVQAVRRHHFSYSQLLAAESSSVVVASIQTAQVPDGVTAGDLLSEIMATLTSDPVCAVAVFQRAVLALGRQLFDPFSARYDRVLARESLILLSFSEVPAVDLQPGVVDVNWTAELPASPTGAAIGALGRLLVAGQAN